ncbi:MAG: glycoside hydrolase family 3 N-terminal domain-containing protein [Gemmatimonadales bacterium]
MTVPGRLILPALRWNEATGFSHEATIIEQALAFGAGGFILFGGTKESVTALTRGLTARAGRPLLIAADLERGAGQQVRGLTELPPPAALASLGDPAAIRWAGAVTAREARSVGINWVLAPVADLDLEPRNPIVQSRSFGADSVAVGAAVAEWVRGCAEGGALACAKHWPGHGRTVGDSHDGVPVVVSGMDALTEDAEPFRAAIKAGVAAVMTAHVAFPALDPSGAPATFSALILGRLRREFGFDGLVVTDALMMEGALGQGIGGAAVAALAAGCDLLLYPKDPVAAHSAVAAALSSGKLPRARVDEALQRYERALLTIAPVPSMRMKAPFASADALADALVARGPRTLRLTAPLSLAVIDDDQGGAWPVGSNEWVEQGLKTAGVQFDEGGSRVVLAFAEPRASKGRAGFSPAHRAEIAAAAMGAAAIILFGHPRLLEELPGDIPVIVAWHRQRLMQDAAARWIRRRLR